LSAVDLRIVRHADERTLVPATDVEPALRPSSFRDYVGQSEVIANLRGAVRAAKRGGWQLDHVLLAGPAGTGKTSCAHVIANELGARCTITSATAIEHKGALASLLTTLADGDVLFIDEIHALVRALPETIYSALEDRVIDLPAGKRVIRVPLSKFTLLAATTHAGMLPKPLRDRFGIVCQLRTYTIEELATIVARAAAKLGIAIDEEGSTAIARASRGTPRVANRLLRRVRDIAANAAADAQHLMGGSEGRHHDSSTINDALAVAALAHLGIDEHGLDQLDRAYLGVVAERPVGIEAICAELAQDRSTIEEVVEPHLLQLGFLVRTVRGRVLSPEGREHLSAHYEQGSSG
jgi:Holliday junction DNA helicase RuvB